MIVVDASVLANVVGDDGEDGDRARRVIGAGVTAGIPDLADVETTSVLRKRYLAGSMDRRRFLLGIRALATLPFKRYPTWPLLSRIGELVDVVSACDAVYVALAEKLGAELLTADGRLARAGPFDCPIRVL